MKRLPIFNLLVILSFLFTGLAMPTAVSANSAQTYTVLVGAEKLPRASGVMAFFPATLHIHVGDTVIWKQNTHEIHTVTFLVPNTNPPDLLMPAPAPFPPGSFMLNPQAAFPTIPAGDIYDGSFINSGIMSTDPGQTTQFSLIFNTPGTFTYLCLVHGMMMSGTVVVEAPTVPIPSPAAVSALAQKMIVLQLARANALFGEAMSQVPAPQHNSDGTTSYTVLIGWSKGQYELMDFFPGNLVVHPGDTVTFMLSSTNVAAPHTVTFLNGAADIPFITPIAPPFPPILLINPDVMNPINPGQPLTRDMVYSSGLLNPLSPGPKSYTITIGDISGDITYQCLLHDTSGMVATLKVVP